MACEPVQYPMNAGEGYHRIGPRNQLPQSFVWYVLLYHILEKDLAGLARTDVCRAGARAFTTYFSFFTLHDGSFLLC